MGSYLLSSFLLFDFLGLILARRKLCFMRKDLLLFASYEKQDIHVVLLKVNLEG